MRILAVGDLHVQISNLEETNTLFSFIRDTVKSDLVDLVVFLGDIFHTHAVLRLEVADCVLKNIRDLSNLTKVIIIAGNHDGFSPKSVSINSSDLILNSFATVVSSHEGLWVKASDSLGLGFLPYMYDGQEFLRFATKLFYAHSGGSFENTVLFCHQPFRGAVYENGFLCQESDISPNALPFSRIVSGHIHKYQTFNSLIYVGTPRPVTWSDFNTTKHIMIIDADGANLSHRFIPTKNITSHNFVLEVTEEDRLNIKSLIENFLQKNDFNHRLDKLQVVVNTNDQSFVEEIKKACSHLLPENTHISIKQKPIATFYDRGLVNLNSFSWEKAIEQYITNSRDFDKADKPEIIKKSIEVWQTIVRGG